VDVEKFVLRVCGSRGYLRSAYSPTNVWAHKFWGTDLNRVPLRNLCHACDCGKFRGFLHAVALWLARVRNLARRSLASEIVHWVLGGDRF
jgi:hypothetical protein